MANQTVPLQPSELTGPPRLIVGWRSGGTLAGRQVVTHEDTWEALRDPCQSALEHLADGEVQIKPYEPFAALDEDQAFEISLGSDSGADLESSTLADLVGGAHELEVLSADELANHRYTFYAIIWPTATGDTIGFVRKKSARSGISPGKRFFVYSQVLRTAKAPDLIIDDVVDVVISGSRLFMLNETSARFLLSDTGIATSGAPANVQAIGGILGGSDRISPDAAAAFTAVAGRKVSFARRLYHCVSFFDGQTLEPERLYPHAIERGISSPEELVTPEGVICCGEDRVDEALDLIEGRFFKDAVMDEERRADRMSRRAGPRH